VTDLSSIVGVGAARTEVAGTVDAMIMMNFIMIKFYNEN
jgi:hypothetical protein